MTIAQGMAVSFSLSYAIVIAAMVVFIIYSLKGDLLVVAGKVLCFTVLIITACVLLCIRCKDDMQKSTKATAKPPVVDTLRVPEDWNPIIEHSEITNRPMRHGN